MRVIDITGRRFGSLMALRPTGRINGARNKIWMFRCDCGRSCEIDGYSVRSGKQNSCPRCGQARSTAASTKHGMSESVEFRTWTDIQTCCHNPNSTSYQLYGGRGIKVCDRWRASFADFLADMGPRPDGHSIDRYPNNNGDYDPSNCRWANLRQQSLNKRTTIRCAIAGQSKTLFEWAELAGLRYATVYMRHRNGYRGPDLIQPLIKGGAR